LGRGADLGLHLCAEASAGPRCGKQVRFQLKEPDQPSRSDATDRALNVAWNWTAVRDTRVVPSIDPVDYSYLNRTLEVVA
jgi:hypothetical protein